VQFCPREPVAHRGEGKSMGEGWKVVITDPDGKAYTPPEFDQLLAA
jgi:hypothetical protein